MAKPFPELTPGGLTALKVSEGTIPYVYDDAVFPTRRWKKGTKVKGFLTAGTGHLLDDAEIAEWAGKDIPANVLNAWLDADTDEAERDVHQIVKVRLSSRQRDALILFRFNIGRSAFQNSTLVRKLNNGDYDSVPLELRKWNKTTINGKKVVSDGLIKRRADEIAMWLSGAVPDPRPADVPSGTQIAQAEKQPITPTEVIGAAGTIIPAASGFAYSTGVVAWAFALVVIAAVLILGAIIIKRYVLTDRQQLPEQEVTNLPPARPRRTPVKRATARKAPVAKPVATRKKTTTKRRAS
jgi:lysozyme